MKTDNTSFETFEEEGKEGNVVIMEQVGEEVTGVFLGEGRQIGEGDKVIGTFAIRDLETGDLLILPKTAVLVSNVSLFASAIIDRKQTDVKHVIQVVYKGMKEGRKNAYRDYTLRARPANDDDLQILKPEEEAADIDYKSFVVKK